MKNSKIQAVAIFGIAMLILFGCMTVEERKTYVEKSLRIRETEITQAFTNGIEKSWKNREHAYFQNILELHGIFGDHIDYRWRNRYTDKDKQEIWGKIANWVDSRRGLSDEDKLAGDALLESFGEKYMPNNYAQYAKVRDAAREVQQVFNENFSQPWTLRPQGPGWGSYTNTLKRFIAVRTDYFRKRDELCHYYLMHRLGAITDEEIVDIDSRPVCVWLQSENLTQAQYVCWEFHPLKTTDEEFVSKYLPETFAVYRKLKDERDVSKTLMDEVQKEKYSLDAIRFERVLFVSNYKINMLTRLLNEVEEKVRDLNLAYKTMEKTAEDLAKFDHEQALALKPLADSVDGYVRDQMMKPVIDESNLVKIPGANFMMLKTEVTQRQWIQVMGNNPSQFVMPSDLPFTGEKVPSRGWMQGTRENYWYYPGFDLPVESVSWNECQEFILRLNAMPATRKAGLIFRLPTRDEWRYACRAGGSQRPSFVQMREPYSDWASRVGNRGKFGRRADGKEGPLNEIGWYKENSQRSTHPVATKIPNAWGLYDMNGNVWEWCSDVLKRNTDYFMAGMCFYVGGSFECDDMAAENGVGTNGCTIDTVRCKFPDYRDREIGFRLVAEKIR